MTEMLPHAWDIRGGFLSFTFIPRHQGPVVRSLVSANRWLRAIKTYRFPWYLTLVSTNHASSNPGQHCTNLDYLDSLGPHEIVRIIEGPDNKKYDY